MLISQSQRALIGVLVYKLGLAPAFLWFINSLYYFSYLNSLDHSVTLSQKNSYLALCCLIAGPLFFFSLKISAAVGYHRLILICVCLSWISAIFLQLNISKWTFLMGVLYCPVISLVLSLIPMLRYCWKFFKQSKNTITGLLAFTASISGIIFMNYYFQSVNPDNLSLSQEKGLFPSQVSDKVPTASLNISYFSGFLQSVGWLLMPKKVKQVRIEAALEQSESSSQQGSQRGWQQIWQLVQQRAFLKLYLVAVLLSNFSMYFGNNFKQFLLPLYSDRFVSYLYSAGLATNTLGSLFWGYLTDRTGFGQAVFSFSALFALSSILLAVSLTFTSSVSQMAWIFVLLVSFVQRGVFVVSTAGLLHIFGEREAGPLMTVKSSSTMVSMMSVFAVQGVSGASGSGLLLLGSICLCTPVIVRQFMN